MCRGTLTGCCITVPSASTWFQAERRAIGREPGTFLADGLTALIEVGHLALGEPDPASGGAPGDPADLGADQHRPRPDDADQRDQPVSDERQHRALILHKVLPDLLDPGIPMPAHPPQREKISRIRPTQAGRSRQSDDPTLPSALTFSTLHVWSGGCHRHGAAPPCCVRPVSHGLPAGTTRREAGALGPVFAGDQHPGPPEPGAGSLGTPERAR